MKSTIHPLIQSRKGPEQLGLPRGDLALSWIAWPLSHLFKQSLSEAWPGLLRSKGFFWLASRPEDVGVWSQAGVQITVEYGGSWSQPDGEEADLHQPESYAPEESHQELVFIGLNLDSTDITKALAACLITDQEMALGVQRWVRFPDPFPAW